MLDVKHCSGVGLARRGSVCRLLWGERTTPALSPQQLETKWELQLQQAQPGKRCISPSWGRSRLSIPCAPQPEGGIQQASCFPFVAWRETTSNSLPKWCMGMGGSGLDGGKGRHPPSHALSLLGDLCLFCVALWEAIPFRAHPTFLAQPTHTLL